eukprot:g26126.t1
MRHVFYLWEDEPTPLLSPGERLIEVCGRLERKLEGIQVVLRTADSMPGNAPKDTRIIVPEVLADPLIMDQVASAYNSCVVERLPGFVIFSTNSFTVPSKSTKEHEVQSLRDALASATKAAPEVEALLLRSASTGSTRTELPVILSSDLLFKTLVPSGFLQDLSCRYQVHIDISADESLPASLRQVVLSGTAAANAAAAYWLQDTPESAMLLGRLVRHGASTLASKSSRNPRCSWQETAWHIQSKIRKEKRKAFVHPW